jgi:hypothetical protein
LPIIKDLKLPSLPPNVTVDDLFVDFLRYMIKQVRAYIEPKYADGKELWETLSPSMYIILTTPNGWEGVQQNRMRSAAIKAGIVDQDGGARIKFVTEAEVRTILPHPPEVRSLDISPRLIMPQIAGTLTIGSWYASSMHSWTLA